MYLDQTRYEAFWLNPEKYRLTYELNLVPKNMAYGLARGTALHTIAEEVQAGKSRDEVNLILAGMTPTSRGNTIDSIEKKAVAMAWLLWDTLSNWPSYQGIQIVECEKEFIAPIPNSPHAMVGRIDSILQDKDGLWCGELKTANPRARYDSFVDDWRRKKQADFEIIGAKSLGFEVEGVHVWQIVEGTPPRIWEVQERRSEHTLAVSMLNVHETCEIIEMMRATFGVNEPWPHLTNQWPCSSSGKCEYETICGQSFDRMTPADLEAFKAREEHLDIWKQQEKRGGSAIET